MAVQQKITRFRAYQLGTAGSSFSYFNGNRFTLFEARYTDGNRDSVLAEMIACGTREVHTLHITSWDQDHCVPSQLEMILNKYNPYKIEYPGYEPHSQTGKDSLKIIKSYEYLRKGNKIIIQVTPKYIASLNTASNYGYSDIFYNPKIIDLDSSNNNSTVKHFRSGSFNVLSLGDVESTHISSRIRSYRSANYETDIMILAHHGADNGFTTSSFLKKVRPKVAIASADYANQFSHPKQEIRDLLYKYKIDLFTTKTGDVVVFSTGRHTGNYKVVNLKAGSSEISSQKDYTARKSQYLSFNEDTLRARKKGFYRGPKRR